MSNKVNLEIDNSKPIEENLVEFMRAVFTESPWNMDDAMSEEYQIINATHIALKKQRKHRESISKLYKLKRELMEN